MKRVAIVTGVAAIGLAASIAVLAPTRVPQAELNVRTRFEPVSIVALIATPERYDGKPVSVFGYVVLGGPLDHWPLIYLHAEDAARGLMLNALWLGFAEGGPIAVATNIDVAPGYASLDGVFHAPKMGRLPGFGGISPVSRLWFTPKDQKPNKAPEPTPTSVTPRATESESR